MRFFGLARPLARYLERLASHDLALRVLGRVRVRVYERIEPLAPAQLEGYRRGDLLSRMVADVDALQNLHLRGVGPPLVALVAGAVVASPSTAAFLPAAALVLAVGLLARRDRRAARSQARSARRAGRRQAAARGELTAELVELLRGAPELAVYGARGRRGSAGCATPTATLVRLGRRAALAAAPATGSRCSSPGATVAGVLAVAVAAHAAGNLDRVLIATLALLALAVVRGGAAAAARPRASSPRRSRPADGCSS